MNKRQFLSAIATAGLLAACSTTGTSGSDPAAQRRSIDAEVDGAMTKLYAQVQGSRELVAKARGVLVFPSVVSGGLIVGGSYGRGELRSDGRTAGYYSTAAASAGLLAGVESKAVYVLFMTQDSLDQFVRSKGWTIGADASVTLVHVGADAGVDTLTAREPVLGFVLSNAGLMAGVALDGTKVSRLAI
jgi:lipid-binding SYLF domain-containing protein